MQESTVMIMERTNKIIEMMKSNSGTITTAQITSAGISRSSLSYLLEKGGDIIRSERGVYILPEVWDDEMFNLQQRYRRGVFSLGTALFLLELTDRTPSKYQMTFPHNYNISNVDSNKVIANRVKHKLHELGKVSLKTPGGGNQVFSYNAERTLCDILKTRNKTDIQLISEAFKNYINSDSKNIVLLSEYSRKISVEKRLRSYLEVLL